MADDAAPSTFLQPGSLAGRTALVTGGGTGLGLEVATRLGRLGANITCASRDVTHHTELIERGREHGFDVESLALDVRESHQVRDVVRATVRRFGGLDILVNNAGMEQVCPSLDIEEELWDQILDTNLKGAFFVAQAAARAMNKGAILNICSLTSERGIPTAVPYGSSKTGLLGMTRALAVEWAPRGIRVNAVEPGYFRTALTEVFYQNDAWQQSMLSNIPLKRFGELSDLVGAAVFLSSDAASYITGACLAIDGGTLASI